MKKNSSKTSMAEKQKRAALKKERRVKRRAVMLKQVESRVKQLSVAIKTLNGNLLETQTALEESLMKVANLTKENLNLTKELPETLEDKVSESK